MKGITVLKNVVRIHYRSNARDCTVTQLFVAAGASNGKGGEVCPSKRVGARSAPSGGSVRTWFSVFLKVATRWRVRWDNDTPSDFACDGSGKNATETCRTLQEAFKDHCSSRTQAGSWYEESREEVVDEPRPGTDDDAKRVREVLRSDRRLTVQQIANALDTSMFVVRRTVTEDRQKPKVHAKLVPNSRPPRRESLIFDETLLRQCA